MTQLKALALVGASLSALALAAPAIAQDAGPPAPDTPTAQDRAAARKKPPQLPPSQRGDTPADQSTPLEQNPGTSANAPASGDVVVTGIRRSLEAAQAIKQNSDAIVDAIVAQDIGKLPDTTVPEALARLPGVQVSRASAEAGNVTIRGLPNVGTTYNGRDLFNGDGRSVPLQDFPAAQIAALEVYKSSVAPLVEGGIGGQINVRSRRPFDFDGLELSGSVSGNYYDQSTHTTPNATFLLSDRWQTGIGEIGILVSGSYTKTFFLDVSRDASGNIATASPAQTSVAGLRYPDAFAINMVEQEFWRPSATFAVQWKPSSTLEFYSDGLFQGYRGLPSQRYYLFLIPGNTTFTNVTLRPGSSNEAQSLTVNGAPNPLAYQQAARNTTNTYQLAGGFNWTPGKLRLNGDLAYVYSEYLNLQNNVDTAMNTNPPYTINYDTPIGAGGPSINYGSFPITDPRYWVFRGFDDGRYHIKGGEWQARLDAEYQTGLGFIPRLQFGVRYTNRDALHEYGHNYRNTDPVTGQYYPNENIPLSRIGDVIVSPAAYRFDDAELVRRLVTLTPQSIRANLDAIRSFVGLPPGPPPYDPASSYTAREKTYAVYGQAKYAFPVGGVHVDGVVGLRVVRSDTTVSGTSRVQQPSGAIVLTPTSQGKERTAYLPNVSARIEFVPNLQLRLAYTKTRTLPNFDQLNPAGFVTAPDPRGYITIFRGNPDLVPLKSNNYDISLEWYPRKSTSATLSFYRRDVNGFPSTTTTTVPKNPSDPNTGGGVIYSQAVALGDARLQGIEAAAQTTFDFPFIPSWARYFGFAANYTYDDAKSALAVSATPQPTDLGVLLPGQQPFAGIARHTYNLIGFYERPEFAIRLGYNWHGDYINTYDVYYGSGSPYARRQYERARGVLDLGASLTPTKNVTITFDISNLTGSAERLINPYDAQGDVYPESTVYRERFYSLGVRFRY